MPRCNNMDSQPGLRKSKKSANNVKNPAFLRQLASIVGKRQSIRNLVRRSKDRSIRG
jgi:hypothetical protein